MEVGTRRIWSEDREVAEVEFLCDVKMQAKQCVCQLQRLCFSFVFCVG